MNYVNEFSSLQFVYRVIMAESTCLWIAVFLSSLIKSFKTGLERYDDFGDGRRYQGRYDTR